MQTHMIVRENRLIRNTPYRPKYGRVTKLNPVVSKNKVKPNTNQG